MGQKLMAAPLRKKEKKMVKKKKKKAEDAFALWLMLSVA